MPQSLFPIRAVALNAPSSGIVEIFDYGRNKQGLLPLWVGEGDLPTPAFITEAARESLAKGETFYTYQGGLPELRAGIATYLSAMYETSVAQSRIFVTSGGMHALQIAVTMVAGPGDEVIVPTPAWPNFRGALTISGATTRDVPMSFGARGWHLDIGDIEAAIGPNTRALCINSPANPTGWMASAAEIVALRDLARRHGLWIIADEIYGRFSFTAPRAPSFRDGMEPEDRILFVQTFSKNWAMTGWRVGWLEAPEALSATIINLIQYSSSGTAVFSQRGALAGLHNGESFIQEQVARAHTNRDVLVSALQATGRFKVAAPEGAFYLFFGLDGVKSPENLAFAMVDHAGLGLAPGAAFGAAGNGFLRLCYLRSTPDIAEAARRLSRFAAAL